MGVDDKIKKKFGGAILRALFGNVFEHFIEVGLWGILLKFYFGLTVKNAIFIVFVVLLLSILKKTYYKEDLYLAFALLLIFQESLLLSWIFYIYVTYFKGLTGFYKPEFRISDKFSALKSDFLGFFGKYVLPFGLVFAARKNRELRDNIFFLTLLAFWHHLNYFIALIIDIIANKEEYGIEKAKERIIEGLKKSRLNIAVTIILLLIFKGVISKFAYEVVSWGILDKIFYWLSWII